MINISKFTYCLIIIGLMCGQNVVAQGGFRGPDETSRPSSEPPPPVSPMTLDLSTNPLATQVIAPKLLRLPSELGNMNYSHVMIAPGISPTFVATGVVNRGDLVATIPFRFRQLGRLNQPVKAGRDGNGTTLLETGALGYRVSSFRVTQGEAFNDAWCFTQATNPIGIPIVKESPPVCLFKLVAGGWVSAPERAAFPNTLFAPRSQRANVGTVAIDPVSPAQAPEKKLEMRFKNWSSEGLILEAFVDGQSIELVSLPKKPTGEVELRLLSESVDFSRASPRDTGARLTTTERAGMSRGSSTVSALDRLNQALDENLVLWRAYHGRPGFEALNTQVASQTNIVPVESLPQARRFMPGQVIATQAIVPTQTFEAQSPIVSRTKRHGEAGTIFFRVTVEGSMHVLCAYDPTDVPPPTSISAPQSRETYCLEDSDNNTTYDTIWRSPAFAPGSRYHLLDLVDAQKLNADASQDVRVRPTNTMQLRPDNLSLVYSGPVYDPVLSRPGLVQLVWRYGDGPFAWPVLALSTNFDAGGTAVFTENSWKPDAGATTGAIVAKITNIQLSGAADIAIMPGAAQSPTLLRRAAIETVVESINQTVAARSALRPTP